MVLAVQLAGEKTRSLQSEAETAFIQLGMPSSPFKGHGIPVGSTATAAIVSNAPPTPLLDLPLELLCKIILLILPEDFSIASRFSRVSRSCREFAINTPMLWGVIDVTHYSINRIKLHLSRSADALLTLRWRAYYYSPNPVDLDDRSQARAEEVLAVLSPHCHRIRDLHMAIEWKGELLDDIACRLLFDSNLMNLEVLTISPILIADYNPKVLPPHYAQKGWPVKHLRLRSLLLTSTSGFWSTALTRLSLSRNTGFSLSELIRILVKLPSLQQLTFEYLILKQSTESCKDLVPLHELTDLRFTYSASFWVSEILTHISTPNLSRLSFGDPYPEPSDPPAPSVHPLITTALSNPQLKQVDVEQCKLSPEEWRRFLGLLPELTHLRCADSLLREPHLAPLRDEPESCCPALINITIDGEILLPTSFARALVEARQHGPTPIRSLVLRGCCSSNVDFDDVMALKKLVPSFVFHMYGPWPEVDDEEQDRVSSESDRAEENKLQS